MFFTKYKHYNKFSYDSYMRNNPEYILKVESIVAHVVTIEFTLEI